eukprot:g534.t1
MLKNADAEIVHIDEMGLRTLAYPINKRNSGVYYCIEFKVPNGEIIDDLELALRRDERIMRFLTFKLDKFGIKYNEDKRNGLIDVEHVGYKHELVTVKDGYGRNYLIPQGLALIANGANKARLKELQRREDAMEAKRLGEYQEMAAKLDGQVLRIGAKAGTSGKIFGSVTNIQVVNALKEQFDLDIERRKVQLPDNVKELGTYTMVLSLHKEVKPEVQFEVVAE